MKTKSKLLFILLFLSKLSYTQNITRNLLPDIKPTNPQAFQFMKYGEVPVGKYTGTPDISIPIYNIKVNGIDIPLTLSYHSNGFKINEESGWTGLGWTLLGLGSINQVVTGTDDFGYFKRRQLQNLSLNNNFHAPSNYQNSCNSFITSGQYPMNFNIYAANLEESIGQINGFGDSQPDIFKFNMLGYSGSFVLDWQNENFVCLTDKNIKIEVDYSDVRPFEFYLTVPEGHKFRFKLTEEGKYILNSSISNSSMLGSQPDLRNPGESAFRTYQLTEITSNQGDRVVINYSVTNEIIGYPSLSSKFYFIEPNANSTGLFPNGMNILGYTQSDLVSTKTIISQKYSNPSSIIFKEGKIEFLTSNREDISGAIKLDKINVLNNSGGIIKTINFNYDYFIGHLNGNNIDLEINNLPSFVNLNKTQNELTHRLKLLSLNFSNENPYTFEYYESKQLPKKTSLASDYWGYYNGQLNNLSIFPNFYMFNLYRDKLQLMQFENNNKSPNFEFCVSSLLKKITYPTKGNTEFEYEMNSFDNFKVPNISQGQVSNINISTIPYNISGLKPSKAILIEGGNTIFKGTAQLNILGCNTVNTNNAYLNSYVKIIHYKKEIIPIIKTVPNYQLFGIEYALTQIPNLIQYIDSDVKVLIKTNNSPLNENFSNLLYNLSEGIVVFSVSGGCGVYGSGANSSNSGNLSHTSLSLTYRNYTPLLNYENFGAGLRIKTIKDFTSNNNLFVINKFSYYGGKLMSPLIYTNKTIFHDVDLRPYGNGCEIREAKGTKFNFESSTLQPISTSANGNFVGYNTVVEKKISNNYIPGLSEPSNGKIVSTFTNEPDITGLGDGTNVLNNLILPSEKYYIDNGLLIKEELYKDEETLIKETNNLYNIPIVDRCFYGYRFAYSKSGHLDNSHCMPDKYNIYEVGVYFMKRREKQLLKESKDLIKLGTGDLLINKKYFYNSNNFLSSQVEINSDNIDYETKYSYAHELNNTALINKNMIGIPLKTETFKNGVKLSTQETTYKNWGNNLLAPEIVKAAKGSQTMEDKIKYNLVDNTNGNPLELQQVDNIKICYIWGYNKTLPIAKIENATYASISASTITNLQNLSNTGTEANLILALNNLRTSLPNAMVTTFTHKPLVGVSTVTDPKGDKQSYHYDSFNRLQFVKDKNDKILSENQYHYKN